MLQVLLAFLLGSPSVLGVRHYGGQGRALLQSCEQTTYNKLDPAAITRAPVLDLHWLDKEDQNLLAITKKVGVFSGGLWASTDGGKHWVEQTSLLNQSLPTTEAVDVVGVFTKKSAPQNVFLLGAGSYHWVSADYGKSYTARQSPTAWKGINIKAFKLHPTQEDWLLLLVKRPDCRQQDRAQMECPHDLMYSPNLFSGNPTWVNLTEKAAGKIAGFVDFDWGKNLCPKGEACPATLQVKDETILATMYAKPGDYDQPWDPDVHFVVSDTWFAEFSTHVRCGNMFEIIGKSIYLAMANACPTDINGKPRSDPPSYLQGITLFTSQDGGGTWNQACLPIAVKQEGYELLETHDGTGVIIIVDLLLKEHMPVSNVYTAGPHHALFSLSLKNVYRTEFGFSNDLQKIESLPGVYIANQMVDAQSAPYDDYIGDIDLLAPLVETRITFNGGGRWSRIPAPTKFNHPQCDSCGGRTDCFLHLYGMSSWDTLLTAMPAVYSNPSAPGLIMASGNTAVKGMGLYDEDPDRVCTWLSTDGGVTWSDVAVGTYIYEFADWGGFIVMAKHPGGTDKVAEEVLFSFDGGKCWAHVPFNEAILLDNIRIEPDGQRPRVVVHGRRCRKTASPLCAYDANASRQGTLEGVIYLVDMAELLAGKFGACKETDRERWAIPDPATGGARCVLGRQSFMERRRFSAQCLNGGEYVRPAPTVLPCNCSMEADLECDYGFTRIDRGADCEEIPKANMPFCPAIADHKYAVSSTKKRLVHADTCANIAAILPDTDGKGQAVNPQGGDVYPDDPAAPQQPKHGPKRHSAWFGFFIFLLVVVVCTGGFVAWWIYLASETHRDTVRDLAAGVADVAVSIKHWVVYKFKGRPSSLQETDLGYFQPLGDSNGGDDAHRSLFTLK